MAYSKRDPKTITKHVPKNTSILLIYEILGNCELVEDINVVIVSTVVTPNATLAGVAYVLALNKKK